MYGKYTVYLNDKLESEILEISKKEGCSLTDAICKRLEMASEQAFYQQKITAMEKKIEAIYILVDLLINEIGYVIGVTRASTKSIENIAREGHAYDSYLKNVSSTLKMHFDNIEILENQKKLLSHNLDEAR